VEVRGVGVKVEARHKYHAKLPEQRQGEHLWVVLAMYRVDPTADQFLLDTENLLSIEGTGCFWCEQKWTAELTARSCTGHG
jgi:hypothetical protein